MTDNNEKPCAGCHVLGGRVVELEMQLEKLRAGRSVSSTLLDVAAEHEDPALWAAMQIIKGGNAEMTQGEATELIVGTIRHAFGLMREAEELEDLRKHNTQQDDTGPGADSAT
jgi:hypothetical protein